MLGVIGVLDVNWLTPTKVRQLSVLGERGLFQLNYLTQELLYFENTLCEERSLGILPRIKPPELL